MPASELASERLRDRERLAAAVKEAGAIALSFFRGPLRSWTKGQGDSPVTEADIASNDLLHRRLVSAGDGWLSEESENDPTRLAARRVWVVDPIDGTRAFIAGREDWSISAALVVDGRPVVAALYAPVTDELFLATAGGGAVRNDVADPGQRGQPASTAPASPAQSACWSGSRRAGRTSSRCRACIRWRCGWRGWRTANSMPRLPAATATTGTLRLPIFWCTKPAA